MRGEHPREDTFEIRPVQAQGSRRRYFFDVLDGDLSVWDQDGTELDGTDEAAEEAARVLVELAKGRLPGAKHRALVIQVRDESGPVLKTILSFAVERVAA